MSRAATASRPGKLERRRHGRAASATSRSSRALAWLAPLGVALVAALVFLPILGNGFVTNFDDRGTFLTNPDYRGLGPSQLAWMWTTVLLNQYRPLTWMTYGMDYVLWGLDPFGYHLTSLLLHAVNALLFYLVARRLLALASPGADGRGLAVGAAGAALLFAVHPLRVEVVAWASARADILAGVFLLLALLAYLRASTEAPWNRFYWSALVLYALSLLAKPVALALPVVLAVLDVYPLGRPGVRAGVAGGDGRRPVTPGHVWIEKLPFVAVALAAGVLAMVAKSGAGVALSLKGWTLLAAIDRVLFSIVFHLWKTVLPLGLSPMYQTRPEGALPALVNAGAVLLVTGALVWARRRWPAGLAAWIAYLALLAPTSGVIQYGPQVAADRFTYLPCLGWALLGGAGLHAAWRAWRRGRLGARGAVPIAAVAGCAIVVLGGLTWSQSRVWRDGEALWRHALAVTPSTMTHDYVGRLLFDRGEVAPAVEHFRAAVALAPDFAPARRNLAIALVQRGDLDEAMRHLQRALELDPNPEAHTNIGVVLTGQGKLDEAVAWHRKALALNPALPEAHNNLGFVLARQGRLDEAIAHYRAALRGRPAFPEAQRNLETALALKQAGVMAPRAR